MNYKELTAQDALGLLKIFVAYIEDMDTGELVEYRIKSPTRKAAKHRAKSIIKRLSTDEKEYSLCDFVSEQDAIGESRNLAARIIEVKETTI